jgi:hypothetical protein
VARSQLRFGLEPGTLNRAVENLRDQAIDNALDLAVRAQRTMTDAIRDVSRFNGLDPILYDDIDVVVDQLPDRVRVFTRLSPSADLDHEIAMAVREWGRKAYSITPRNRKALKFYYPGESDPTYSKRVDIPASPAYNILRRARDRVYQQMRRGTV